MCNFFEESKMQTLKPFLTWPLGYFKKSFGEVECFVFICFASVWLRVALETLDRLTESLDFTDYASRIIHPIVRTLDSTPELRSTSMDTLSSLVFQLGKKVAIAVPRALFRCSYYSED